jgi:hypothetical protein
MTTHVHPVPYAPSTSQTVNFVKNMTQSHSMHTTTNRNVSVKKESRRRFVDRECMAFERSKVKSISRLLLNTFFLQHSENMNCENLFAFAILNETLNPNYRRLRDNRKTR